jgi:predicted CXXCH cytochrome family protein
VASCPACRPCSATVSLVHGASRRIVVWAIELAKLCVEPFFRRPQLLRSIVPRVKRPERSQRSTATAPGRRRIGRSESPDWFASQGERNLCRGSRSLHSHKSVPSPTTAWEIAQALGLCAVAVCLVLCVLAVRPRAGADRALPIRGHELLGWLALSGAVLHVGLLLGADPPVVEHVKLTAPRYEHAGILALLTLLFLTVPASAAVRRRLWPRHRNFQAAHVGAACLLVVALAVHVLVTGRYVRGRGHALAYVLLSCIVLLALLRARTRLRSAPQPSRLLGGLVFGRHSRLVLAIVLGSLVALLLLLRGGTALAMREPFLRRSEPLVLGFPHDKHRQVNCIQCHHDYADRTGAGSCISCHRSASAAIRVGAEARFHDFCLGCHRDPPAYLSSHGPATGCETCHTPLPGAALMGPP